MGWGKTCWRAFVFLLFGLGCITSSPLAQRLGDHATAGFDNSRTGLNAHMGNFRPPLKLVRTIELAGISNAEQMLVFEDYLLVGEQGETIRWNLFSRSSGEVLWTHQLPGEGEYLHYTPSYANDVVLLGGSTTTAVKAVRASTGEELWADSSVGDPPGVYPILTDGLAIYGGDQKVVAARAETGDVIWEFEAEIDSIPISLQGNRVYVPSSESLLYVLDLMSGAKIWTLAAEETVYPISNMIPTEGCVFLSVEQTGPDGHRLNLEARSTRDGELMWAQGGSPLRGDVLLAYGQIFAPRDGLITAEISSYDATTGDLVWSETEEGDADLVVGVPPPATVIFGPVIVNGAIYYLNGGAGRVRARDVFTGNCLWNIPLGEGARSVSFADESLFVLYEDRVEVYKQSNEIFFPHIADGAGLRTILALSNLSSEATGGVVEFYNDAGDPLEVDVTGMSGISQVPFTIPPDSSLKIETLGGGELQVGWARVESDQSIAGSAIFQYSDGGDVLFEAGVSASPVRGRTLVQVERLRDFSTGIAVANPLEEAAELLFAFLIDGEEVAVQEMSIPSRGHRARLIEDLFPTDEIGEFQGTLIVESEIPVAVTAVRTQRGYQMSSYPVSY